MNRHFVTNAWLAPAGLATEMDKGCGSKLRWKLIAATRRVYGMYWAVNVAGWRLRTPKHYSSPSGFKRLIASPLLKFLITGVLNTMVGLCVIYLLMGFFSVPERPANSIGYAVGVIFSYQVNSRWTFGYRDTLLPVLPRYIVVIVVAYLANLACLNALLGLRVNGYLAQALALPPYTAIGFLGMRFWVFKKNDRSTG